MTSRLVQRLQAGDRRALPRLITLLEQGHHAGQAALAELLPETGRAHVVGVTGPPGAGKSTLVNALIGAFRECGRRVAVVAVDPSSPLSGGAVLGDRIRMMERHADPDVFIRSMAARGKLGGLAAATADVVHLLDAADFDPVIIETVGAGQDGIDIAHLAQTVVVVQVPGLGDGVQAIKAGVLEVGDILVVNKADLPGARELQRLLRQAVMPLADAPRPEIPVVATNAATGEGVGALRQAIDEHRAGLIASGEWQVRSDAAARHEVLARVRHELERRLEQDAGSAPAVAEAVAAVASRQKTAADAAHELLVPLVGNPAEN